MRSVIVSALLALLLGLTPVADAGSRASGDFVYVTEEITVAPDSAGTVDAICPEGTRAVGAGGGSSGNGIATTQLIPFDSIDGGAAEDNGANAQAWNRSGKPRTLKAVAICSRGSDAASLSYNRASTVFASTTSGGFSPVSCVGGAGVEEALGGGAGVPANAFDRLSVSSPAPRAWVYGIRGLNPSARTLSGVVVCLPTASRDVTLAVGSIDIGASKTATIKVRCPAGTKVTGGGTGNNGIRYEIRQSVPFDGPDRDKVPDDGWALTLRDALDAKHEAEATAMCAGPVLP